MSTLSGFTRPTDPINASDLAALISTALGKTVSAEITPTDILVSGTLSGADQSAVQTAINNYFFGYLQYGAPISDITDMSTGRHDRGITERVAYQGDLATYNAATAYVDGKARKAYVSGVLKNGAFIYSTKATTASGTVIFYITDDGTANGSAVFSNVYADTIAITTYGALGNFQPSTPAVSNDKKSITANISQITNVLGVATINTLAANGVDCRLYIMGD